MTLQKPLFDMLQRNNLEFVLSGMMALVNILGHSEKRNPEYQFKNVCAA